MIAGGCRDGATNRSLLMAEIYMHSKAGEQYFPLMSSVNLR